MDKKLFIYSAILSLSIYILVLGLLFISVKSEKTKYIDSFNKQTSYVDVVIEDKSTQSLEIENKQQVVEKEIQKLSKLFKEVKVEKADKVIVTSGELFSKLLLEVKKAPEFYKEQREDLTDINQKLAQINSKSNITFKATANNSDPYYSKIYDILSLRWKPKGITQNLTIKALITIYSNGKFDYVILSKSGNFVFDSDLIIFLDTQKSEQYPPFKDGYKTNIEIIFKSKGM